MQSQYEDISECSGCCAGYVVLNMCRIGGCKILEVRQDTMERMGEERQGDLYTPCTTG